MEDYLAWRQKDQSFLLAALADTKRTRGKGGGGGEGDEDEVITLPELSEQHSRSSLSSRDIHS